MCGIAGFVRLGHWLTLAANPAVLTVFLLALALFVGGYLLQFAGHLLEGTDPGEIIYFKRKLGLSYVEFPRRRAACRQPSVEAESTSGG